MKLYQGGKIASTTEADPTGGDVLVDESGRIAKTGKKLKPPEGAKVIDCGGKILVPGMFDIHVHGRDPGFPHQETLESCARAALRGGVTGAALMPDTNPVVDNGNLARRLIENASQHPLVDFCQMGAISKGIAGEELASIGGMAAAGVAMLSDSGNAVDCPLLMRRAMEYALEFDLSLASRGETRSLSQFGAINEGSVSYRLGLSGLPAIAEEIGIDRDLRIARFTGGRLHVQQVSTASGLQAIRRAKEDGVHVTCEVSPHHLLLNEEDIPDYDANYKMTPPLRTRRDNEALLEGLVDGAIDVIATNHSPHTRYEKRTDFASAPFGITGLETAVVSLFDRLIKGGFLGWDLLVERFSSAPRRILKLEEATIEKGNYANFFVFDPDGATDFLSGNMESKSENTPFLNQTLSGKIEGVARGATWREN